MPLIKYTLANSSLSAGTTLGTKSLGTSQSITFSVPDGEENDSHSELSDDSVQVLDSNTRAYSVPFSDDDLDSEEVEDSDHPSPAVLQSSGDEEHHATENDATINKAAVASQQHVNVWTEPSAAEELQFVSSSKAQDQKFTSAEIIVTKHVERSGSSAYNSLIVGSDSEDEAPEVLSSKPRQHGTDQRKTPATTVLHSASKYRLSLPSFGHGGHDRGHQIVTENDGASSSDEVLTGSEQDSLQEKPISIPTGGSRDGLGAGQAGLDDGSCFPQGRCDISERSFASASRQVYPSSLTSSLSAGENTSEGELVKYWPPSNLTNQSHVQQETQQRAAQRPPSPSDAALARNGSTFWFQEAPDRDGEFHPSYNYPSLPYARDPAIQKSSIPWNNFGTPSSNTRENSLLDVGDGSWSRYDDGPFAHRTTLPSTPALSPPLHQVPQLEPIARKLATAPPQVPIAFADEVLPLMERTTESTSPAIINEKASINLSEEAEYRRKSNEGHSSRLNIMDIVNPLTDTSRSLKRKAEEISTNDVEKNDNDEPGTEALEEGGLTSDGEIEQNNQEDKILISNCELPSQDPAALPPQISEGSAVSGLTGPARKKQKTSDSSAIGIGKFVSGVLVGVAGAFAAFVATIPMSVQNEALQEISRAS